MSSTVKYEVLARNGSYVNQQGEEKTRWLRCGVVFESEQGNLSMKLECLPIARNENGELFLSLFVPRERNQQRQAPQQRQPVVQQPAPQQPAPQQGGFREPTPDDIPF